MYQSKQDRTALHHSHEATLNYRHIYPALESTNHTQQTHQKINNHINPKAQSIQK